MATNYEKGERAFQDHIKNKLPADSIAVDVGARASKIEVDYTNLLASILVNGKVIAIDAVLGDNLEVARQRKNVTVIQAYLSDVSDELIEVRWKDVAGGGSGPPLFDRLIMETKRLDDLVELCDLIKIDVEGHEYRVLKGAENLLTRSRPVLLLEFHPFEACARGGSRRPDSDEKKDLQDLLQAHNYEIYNTVSGIIETDISKIEVISWFICTIRG